MWCGVTFCNGLLCLSLIPESLLCSYRKYGRAAFVVPWKKKKLIVAKLVKELCCVWKAKGHPLL